MATYTRITLHERNDELLRVTIVPEDPDEDLDQIVDLEFFLKTDDCVDDDCADCLILTSADPSEIMIISQTTQEIVAQVLIPSEALQEPYDRFWRIDGITAGGDRITAMYGPAEVVNL